MAIKEENELLKEQDLIRVEFVERLEKKQEQLETEVRKLNNLTLIYVVVGFLQGAKLRADQADGRIRSQLHH